MQNTEIFEDLLLISALIVYITDLSCAINNLVKPLIKKILDIPSQKDITIKPFDCSLCLTFWIGLIYLIINQSIGLIPLFILTTISFLTDNIKDIFILIKDSLTILIRNIYNKIDETD